MDPTIDEFIMEKSMQFDSRLIFRLHVKSDESRRESQILEPLSKFFCSLQGGVVAGLHYPDDYGQSMPDVGGNDVIFIPNMTNVVKECMSLVDGVAHSNGTLTYVNGSKWSGKDVSRSGSREVSEGKITQVRSVSRSIQCLRVSL